MLTTDITPTAFATPSAAPSPDTPAHSTSATTARAARDSQKYSRELGGCYHDWDYKEAVQLFEMPFNDLLFKAATVHRAHFDANAVQMSTLCNVKTGGCSEDCKYCSQSSRYDTGVAKEKIMPLDEVIRAATAAKANGATRFCMGAAWRNPNARQLEDITAMVRAVKGLGLETRATLGMLDDKDAEKLRDAGLDYYNHNLDTSEAYYASVITTRTFQDRLDTLKAVRKSGMKVCSGGIIGMGEQVRDRAQLLTTFANLSPHPESVPINLLVPIEGTPMYDMRGATDVVSFIRTIAVARIMLPRSFVRLSAGRESLGEAGQALAFFAGANSIFYGDRLLTTDNPEVDKDHALFAKLGLYAMGDASGAATNPTAQSA